MAYCLNPECAKLYNSDQSQFCLTCGNQLRLKDRYQAIDIIGQGGFGKTFLAVDDDKPSKPRCVIKQFFPQSQDADTWQKASELFAQEAIRLDELGKHSHIPELLAYITILGHLWDRNRRRNLYLNRTYRYCLFHCN